MTSCINAYKDGLSPELRFTEGAGNWAQYIADVREAISPWHRPDHLSETEAYQVRQGGTISAKDRLLELCELSSILQFNIIESEAEAAGIPARQTTNRYWGISPQGGDSEEDVYAWHYFMDLDRTWATSRADLIQPHFDEVSALSFSLWIWKHHSGCEGHDSRQS